MAAQDGSTGASMHLVAGDLLVVLDALQLSAFVYDGDGVMQYCNDRLVADTGWRRADLVRRSYLDTLVPPDGRARASRFLERMRSGALEPRYVGVVRRADGDERRFEWSNAALRRNGVGILAAVSIGHDVTERRRADDALRDSERRLAELLDDVQLIAAMAAAGPDAPITFCNQYLADLTGWRREEIVGRVWKDVFAPDGVSPEDRRFQARLREGDVTPHYESPIMTRRAERRLVAWNTTGIRDAEGRVTGWASIGVDVTEQRRVEEALRESERSFREMLENVPLLASILTPDGRIVFANEHMCEVTGWTRDELVGRGWLNLLTPPSHREVDEAAFAEVAYGYVTPGYDGAIITRSGEERAISWSNAALRDVGGRIAAVATIGEDVTDRRRAEAALAESEERLRLAMEAGRMGASDWDVEARRARWSPVMEQLHGLQPGTFSGDPADAQALLHPEDRDRIAAEAVDGAIESSSEARVIWPDGTLHWLAWRTRKEYDERGALTRVIGLAWDMTEQRQAQEALAESERRRREALAQMVRAEEAERDRIAVGLHDDTIQVMTAALLSTERLDAAIRDGDGDRAGDAVRRLRADLGAAVERARRVAFELRPPLLERGGVAQAIADLAEEIGAGAGFAVAIERDAVGRYDDETEILAYRAARELLANVRKHAAATRVEVRLREVDGGLLCEVADDGRGYPADVRSPRRRLHFGLAAVGERVRLAGGRLEVQSEPGHGTVARFWLPAARREGDETEPPATPETAIRCLVVDDHPAIRAGLRALFRGDAELGVVGEAAGAAAAVDLVARRRPDIVVMDVELGEGANGLEATREILVAHPDVAVVLYTGHGTARALADALACGARGYILKDAPAEDVVRAVKTVARGGTYLDPTLVGALIPGVDEAAPRLSARETDVLRLMARGRSNAQIAQELFVSAQTVKTHVRNVLGKLGAETRAEAVAEAMRHSLIR
jgi:PAS domain S-box-containing protein